MRSMLRSLMVWLVIMAVEILHGILRTLLFEPLVGDLRARQIGVVTGSLIILGIAYAFVGWIGAATRKRLLAVGALWVALTLTFEIGFGRFVMGFSWDRLRSDYNPAEGGLLAFGMIVLMLSPLLAARIRAVRPSGKVGPPPG